MRKAAKLLSAPTLTGRMRYIDKNDWCAVNEASGRNWPRKCILHRSVRPACAHAALRVRDGFLFGGVLLGQTGAQKQRQTNDLC